MMVLAYAKESMMIYTLSQKTGPFSFENNLANTVPF